MAATEQDYYELLGIQRDATDDEVKRAFRRLARELHPDVSDAPDAQERFRQVAEAYEVLSDPSRRSTYDRFGHAGVRAGGFNPGDVDLGNLGDVFSAFFGDGIFGTQSGAADRPSRGADVGVTVEITLADAFNGVEVDVPVTVAATCDRCGGNGAEPGTSPIRCPSCAGSGRVQHVSNTVFGQFVRSGPCPRCEGAGRIVESPCESCDGAGAVLVDRTLDVDIPAGIHDGQRIRVRESGHAGTRGGPPGDVYVQVRVTADATLIRDGDDLVAPATLTIFDASLGTTITVPLPDGDLAVEIEPGAQPGDVVVVRGRGMPALDRRRRGDLRVHVEVAVPRELTDTQREDLERLRSSIGPDAYGARDDGLFGRLRNAFR